MFKSLDSILRILETILRVLRNLENGLEQGAKLEAAITIRSSGSQN